MKSLAEIAELAGVSKGYVSRRVHEGKTVKGIDLGPYVVRENGAIVGYELPEGVSFHTASDDDLGGFTSRRFTSKQVNETRSNPAGDELFATKLAEVETRKMELEFEKLKWDRRSRGLGEAMIHVRENPEVLVAAATAGRQLVVPAAIAAGAYLGYQATDGSHAALRLASIVTGSACMFLLADWFQNRESSLLGHLLRLASHPAPAKPNSTESSSKSSSAPYSGDGMGGDGMAGNVFTPNIDWIGMMPGGANRSRSHEANTPREAEI